MTLRRLIVSAFAALMLGTNYPCGAVSEGQLSPWRQVDSKMRISVTEATKYQAEGDQVRMESGALMLEASSGITIKLPMSTVAVKSRSLVFVRAREGCEHIFVLLGNGSARVDKQRALLNTGEEAVVTNHDPGYKDLAGEDDIGRRRLRLTQIPGGKTFGISEFSLVHAVEREPLIAHLIHSDDAHDRALKERLLKTAAVLGIVTARHGQYSAGR